MYEEARKLYEECRAEEEEKNEKENNEEDDMSTTYWTAGSREGEASEQQCGKTAEETNIEFRNARLMNDYYEDYEEEKQYEYEIWSSYSNQCDNSTISSVNQSRNDEDEEYKGIT